MRGKVTQLWLKRDLIKSSFGICFFVLLVHSLYAQSPREADLDFRELQRKIQSGNYDEAEAHRFVILQIRGDIQAVLPLAAQDPRLNTVTEDLLVEALDDETKKESPNWDRVTDLLDVFYTVTSGRAFSAKAKALFSTFGSEKDTNTETLTLEGIAALPVLRGLKQKNLQIKMRQWGFPEVRDGERRGRISVGHRISDAEGFLANFEHIARSDLGTPEHERGYVFVGAWGGFYTYRDGQHLNLTSKVESYIKASQAEWNKKNKQRIARENREAAKKAREALKKAEKAGATTTSKSPEGTFPAELDAKNREHADKTGESASETREKKNRGSKKPKSGEAK